MAASLNCVVTAQEADCFQGTVTQLWQSSQTKGTHNSQRRKVGEPDEKGLAGDYGNELGGEESKLAKGSEMFVASDWVEGG